MLLRHSFDILDYYEFILFELTFTQCSQLARGRGVIGVSQGFVKIGDFL